ncbi:MAG: DNA double-strand break repair nuclease NurA [Methanobacteriota archaeon]|nr:MAG: DNA double-strand break repair nuclease NurA [Euryarchaeota archaeon]
MTLSLGGGYDSPGNNGRLLQGIESQMRDIFRFRSEYVINFDAIKFKEFGPREDAMDMVAIDGSYTFLLNVSSMWLGIVRAGALRYSFKDKGYQLVDSKSIDVPITISTWKSIVETQSERHRIIYKTKEGSTNVHKEMMNEFRHCIEGEIALSACKKHKDCIIAIDGALVAYNQELDWLRDVVDGCNKNGNILIGVSKDSHTHAFNNPRRDEEIFKLGDGIAFVRVPEFFERNHRGTLYGSIYFAKFQKDAPKWFRVDIGTFKEDPSFALSNVAVYSNSGLCLGYPYPLLEAHRFAVTVRQFKDMYEDMMFKIADDCGFHAHDILEGLTHTEGDRKGAYHEYIDKVSRDLR